MSLPCFHYLSPRTVQELCAMVDRHQEKGKVFAGGTDVLVRMKDRVLVPQYLIDIKRISGLNYIRHDNVEGLRIGAATTLRVVEASPLIREKFPVIAQAAHWVGSVQIRNRGTVAGNLCNASPSADMAPSLIVLGATLVLLSTAGERIVNLEDFFTGPGATVMRADEVVSEIRVPDIPPQTGVAYFKHGQRKAMDLAIVGVAAKISLDQETRKCSGIRIVLGAVAPTPMRAKGAEAVLLGKEIEGKLLEQASREAAAECSPISDVRSSAGYRREMVNVFAGRALRAALAIAQSGQ